MRLDDLPAFALGVTISAYWFCVGVKVFKVSRSARRLGRVLIPTLRTERLIWLVWVPVIVAWIVMPYVAPAQAYNRHPWIGMSNLYDPPVSVAALRILAALAAVVCLVLSIKCWRYMGRNWRMAIDPAQKCELLCGGPFAVIRHPIYALSMTLMLCSVLILPTRVMMILAVLHIALLYWKARNEERFLFNLLGSDYNRYCERTPRFLPRTGFLRVLRRRSARGNQPL